MGDANAVIALMRSLLARPSGRNGSVYTRLAPIDMLSRMDKDARKHVLARHDVDAAAVELAKLFQAAQ
jgi:hypothetical protein